MVLAWRLEVVMESSRFFQEFVKKSAPKRSGRMSKIKKD
jgi:hypothetical protein